MTFDVPAEHTLFAESVRTAIGAWEPQREPELGAWLDDRDDALADRLAGAGWSQLWAGEELLGATVAGAVELGRAAAPASLLDEPTLGAPLWVEGRARHGRGAGSLAVPRRGGGLALATPTDEGRAEPTLDGSGTILVELASAAELEPVAAAACWRAWNAADPRVPRGARVASARARGRARTRTRAVRRRRWRRFPRCSPGSRTLRSRRMRSRSSGGPRPRTTKVLRTASCAGPDQRAVMSPRAPSRCMARSALRSRPACTCTTAGLVR